MICTMDPFAQRKNSDTRKKSVLIYGDNNGGSSSESSSSYESLSDDEEWRPKWISKKHVFFAAIAIQLVVILLFFSKYSKLHCDAVAETKI